MKQRNLILVRHGQSEWNEKNLFTGWENPGLTQKGEKEAKDAGKIINGLGINFDYLYTSALIRAQLTGSIILSEINQKNVNTLRTEKVIRYVLGSGNNEEVFFESDDEFNLYSYKTKSGKYIIISSGKTISDEIRFINADRPNQEFKIFQKRIDGLEYSVDHLDDKWYIRTNINNSQNFKLMVCDENKTSSENWKDFIKHRENVLLENVEVFNEFFVVTERENGQRRFNVISKEDGESHYIDFEEEAFSAYSSVNAEMNSVKFRYGYSSMTTPNSTIEYDLVSRKKTNALITDPEQAKKHVLKMVQTQSLNCHSGKQIPCEIDSVCIHGDNLSSLATAKSIRKNLVENGLELKTLNKMKKFI